LVPETGFFTTLVWIAWGPGRNWLVESLENSSTIDGLGY
jgi:hypothetical protein